MDGHTENTIERLKVIGSLVEVRRAMARKEFGDFGSPTHDIATQWLLAEEKAQEAAYKPAKNWHENPIGKIGIALAIAVLAFLATHLIAQWL